MARFSFPSVPARHANFLRYIQSHPNTPVRQLLQPYSEYDAVARQAFAQEPSHPALQDNHLNVIPLYGENGSTDAQVRARDLSSESDEQKEKYILPLKDENRRANGSPAVVQTLKDFQNNFALFSEGSLSDLDWSNVVVAGSAVVTALMPVPEKHRASKRALRQFYHEKFAPASDVDLFLYGLTDEQAVEKIKQIEERIRNAILYETTTVRTKNTVTIVSQYPTRHVQIVLRIYKSIAEILTGFDVDCSCAAYDGKQVYASPRALASYITQTNDVDLTRRSPSYENRLSKYSHRGFEVYWPQLNRSKIDPTIFERSFPRTIGLARLLVLEKLPTSSDRESYLTQRRLERGRPLTNTSARSFRPGNIKDQWEDETPEWQEEDEISDYNSFRIPYGPKYHARRIMKLFYTKDLLLNAEWNRSKARKVDLHRHPAFFGQAEDVIHDCCGDCPQPETQEEKEVAEAEAKTYVSGEISFIKDDPGRQAIGSFNPITETDWTEMAYVGNTERLCQAIIEHDLESVKDWFKQESVDANTRDYTGRTPLQLACMTSTPEIVQCLVENGARLIARMADGKTALHIAAARGNIEIIKVLLNKSEQNEEEESKKQDLRKEDVKQKSQTPEKSKDAQNDEEDGDLVSYPDDSTSRTESFVDVAEQKDTFEGAVSDDANELEPDIYDVNILEWTNKTSPLHLAILNGHVKVVEELVSSFGADVLLPIKLTEESQKTPKAAILTLVLALRLPLETAKAMTDILLRLGASPAQGDVQRRTPIHYLAATSFTELLEVYLHHNEPAVKRAINHLAFADSSWNPDVYSAFGTAINARNETEALRLLKAGAESSIPFERFLRSGQGLDRIRNNSSESNKELFRQKVVQPVILAVKKELPLVALEMVHQGVDVNTLTPDGYCAQDEENSRSYTKGQSLLDYVREKLKVLRKYDGEKVDSKPPTPLESDDAVYLSGFKDGSYQMWAAKDQVNEARKEYEKAKKDHEQELEKAAGGNGQDLKISAVQSLIGEYEKLEKALIEKDAKPFYEMFPDYERPDEDEEDDDSGSKSETFKVKFTFDVHDLTDTRKEGYLKLFEAAWSGDLETIRSLTTGVWGEKNDQTPLQITVFDDAGVSPFAIAILRGHRETAKGIVEISKAQYQPKKARNQRYKMDDDSENESEDGVPVYAEMIDDDYTVDNIGEVPTEVFTDTPPLKFLSHEFPILRFTDPEGAPKRDITSLNFRPRFMHTLSWMRCTYCDEPRDEDNYVQTLLEYAIWTDDTELLVFLLELGQELIVADSEQESSLNAAPPYLFDLAMKLGNLRALEELIKRTGVGLPLDELVQTSGVEVKPKTRYYRGLTFHGKKHENWAVAERKRTLNLQKTNAPALNAAFHGTLASVEWFLGTAPKRYYNEFAKAHADEEKIKAVAQSKEGIEGLIGKWLGMRNNLVLHCAIMARPDDESERLVKYLIENVPECLEARSSEGYTPLALAFSLQRKRFAEILIQAGANQTTRDKKGNNLLHLLLCDLNETPRDKPDGIKEFLELLDPRLVSSLLIERSSDEPGSVTPIARWMHTAHHYGYSLFGYVSTISHNRDTETDGKVEVMRLLLDFAESTGQEHLQILDGAGNTPVHDAVAQQLPRTFQLMIERRPDLLHRESATGITPFELAVDKWVNQASTSLPWIPKTEPSWAERDMDEMKDVVDRSPEYFTQEKHEQRSERQMIVDLCRRSEGGHKRKLVSLTEANVVAKRLAARQQQARERELEADQECEVYGERLYTADEVGLWYQDAKYFK